MKVRWTLFAVYMHIYVCGRTDQLYLLVACNDMLCDVMCCVEWWHVFFVLVLKCTSQCLGHSECSRFHLWVESNQYAFLSISGQGYCSGLFVIGRCDVMSFHSLLHAVGDETVIPDFIIRHNVK